MPYIDREVRKQVESVGPTTAGELNYTFTLAILAYIEKKGLSYQTLNDIMGAMEGAKQEMYRRVAVKYENQKIFDNGDVY